MNLRWREWLPRLANEAKQRRRPVIHHLPCAAASGGVDTAALATRVLWICNQTHQERQSVVRAKQPDFRLQQVVAVSSAFTIRKSAASGLYHPRWKKKALSLPWPQHPARRSLAPSCECRASALLIDDLGGRARTRATGTFVTLSTHPGRQTSIHRTPGETDRSA